MSAAPLYLVERPGVSGRLRSAVASLARNRRLMLGIGVAGLLLTFGTMLATGGPGRIGSIWLVPWVALLATQLGPAWGAASGAAATGLYLLAAELTTDPDDGIAFMFRLVALIVVGVAAGLSSRRISSDSLALQSTGALQQALLDSTIDGICLTDSSGNIVLANAPLQRFGAEFRLPLHGTVAERLLTLADRTTEPARFVARMREIGSNPVASEDEFELTESGRVFRGYTAPVTQKDGTLVGRIWTLREVTADNHLERLRDTFVAAVSHELRTPLTSITGFLEMLGDEEEELSPAGRTYLSVIRRGTSRLRRIVEDLLLVAQIEANRLELEPEPTDLRELTTAAVEAALPDAAEKGIDLQLDAGDSLPLEADAGRLRQVLDGLVSNALKFTPPGGTVTVSASSRDGELCVDVVDTGIGIPPDEVGQVFSRFYRASTATRRAIPGTGLGLAIARAIVEDHGGTSALASREGEGTRVSVALPSSRSSASLVG